MSEHPTCEQPLSRLSSHAGAARLAVSTSEEFGFRGQFFVALFGDPAPITGPERRSGSMVLRVDRRTGEGVPFFRAKLDRLGPAGYEYVATAGPRRPVDVVFPPTASRCSSWTWAR